MVMMRHKRETNRKKEKERLREVSDNVKGQLKLTWSSLLSK